MDMADNPAAGIDKIADLAGPGISTYEKVKQVLPKDYNTLLDPKETQKAIALVICEVEDGLCRELILIRVECPLIMDCNSGMNDYLDRDDSQTPIDFQCGLGQSRIYSYILKQAALGKCSVTVWPPQLHEICEKHNIYLLK